jgi:hypothetical protein
VERGFVLGFANTREDRMAPAVRRLVEAIEETGLRPLERRRETPGKLMACGRTA